MTAQLKRIIDDWFLLEPVLFAAFFTHKVVENTTMSIPFRVGEMRLEYNPSLIENMGEVEVEARLRYEMIRILLGHPYQRQPIGAQAELLTLASNCTIFGNYRLTKYLDCGDMGLPRGLCFEEYYALLRNLMPPTPGKGGNEADDNSDENDEEDNDDSNKGADGASEGDDSDSGESEDSSSGEGDENSENSEGTDNNEEANSGGIGKNSSKRSQKLSEASELWKEDELAQEEIHQAVQEISQSDSWGTVPGNIVEMIKSTLVAKVDYRKILSLFRASILSTSRHLTRMLPSRRYGFEFMGSKRDFTTSLLVAIDVSGSVSDKQVEVALAVINRGFKYGVQQIDVVQFDTELRGEVMEFKKAKSTLAIEGRGGTCFQPIIDYYAKSKYDGLLIITDGEAPAPILPPRFPKRVLWMLYNESTYKSANRYTLPKHLKWITQTPKYRYLILPPVN